MRKAAVVAFGVLGMAEVSASYSYLTPPNIGDGWDTAHYSEVGLDIEILSQLMDRIFSGSYPNIHSVVVIKDGRLAFEEYFPGLDYYSGRNIDFNRYTLHELHSVTKSFNSALVGIAIEQQLISGVDAFVANLYPRSGYADIFIDPLKKQMRLRDMLTMTSGIQWDEQTYPYTDPRNDHVKMNSSSDQIRYVLSRPMTIEPGKQFLYNSGISIAIGGIVGDASSMKADDFAREFLFKPLGITNYDWYRYPNGVVQTGGGLRLRPRGMAKFGYLFMNGGRWKGEQVVPENWVLESTDIQVPKVGPEIDYGYQWVSRNVNVNDRIEKVVFATGRGGQYIFLVPSLDLVAVFTAWNEQNGNRSLPRWLLRDYIVPASVPTSPLVESGSVYSPEHWRDLIHSSGVLYDEALLNGTSASVVAIEGTVTRLKYEDLNGDIVCIEFSGDGVLSVELEQVPHLLRTPPSRYNETSSFTKGNARLILEGATENTYLSVCALGPENGDDPTLFLDGEIYDGQADLKSIQISGSGLGGLYCGNACFSGSEGLVGIDASSVPIRGRVAVGEIAAYGDGEPSLLLGASSELDWDSGAVLVASSSLEQPNGRPVAVSGFNSILSIASRDSNGEVLSAERIVASFADGQNEAVELSVSMDSDESDWALSAPFVSELMGGVVGAVPAIAPIGDRQIEEYGVALSANSPYARMPLGLSVSSGHARIEGDQVLLTGVGEVAIRATLPETPFSVATSVEETFTVSEVANPEGDADGDGVANIVETAFGMNVHIPDREKLPRIEANGDGVLYLFSKSRTDLQYVLESSSDLITWNPEGVLTEETNVSPLDLSRVMAPENGALFVRLRVERPN